MIKKIAKTIREQLLKVEWIRREVEAYQLEQKKQRHYHCWEMIMRGQTMRDSKTEKSNHKTQATVTDEGILVDYMDGRMIGQRGVTPNVIRPFGLRRDKF